MKYLKIKNGVIAYPYATLFADHPNVSFPSPLTEDVLAAFGVFPVAETAKPSCLWWQALRELPPVWKDGQWREAWEVYERSTDERATLTAEAWKKLRVERDVRLAACDWTQLPDSPTDQSAWAAYRQRLRDLPAVTSDPFTAVWPIPPD